jgi:hypothetical protein
MIICDGKYITLCPKTGCNSFRNALRNYYHIKAISPFHGIPTPEMVTTEDIVLTVVRHPAMWLRSFWGDRKRSRWAHMDGNSSPIWSEICRNLQPPKPLGWDDFWQWYVKNRHGFLYYTYNKYGKYATHTGRTEHLEEWVKSWFPEVKLVGIDNTGPNLPKIQPLVWDQIEVAEKDVMYTWYSDVLGLDHRYTWTS